jgi:hypothetical protein
MPAEIDQQAFLKLFFQTKQVFALSVGFAASSSKGRIPFGRAGTASAVTERGYPKHLCIRAFFSVSNWSRLF